MAKLPAFQFYTGDWLKDPELSMCSPSTQRKRKAVTNMHQNQTQTIGQGSASRTGDRNSSSQEKPKCRCGRPLEETVLMGRVFRAGQCAQCADKQRVQEARQALRQIRKAKAERMRRALERVIPPLFASAHLRDLNQTFRRALLDFDRRVGLVLFGPAGRGKSFAMAALARYLILRGKNCKRITYEMLCMQIRNTYKQGSGQTELDVIRPLIQCDCLFIEDFNPSAAGKSDFQNRILYTLLNGRLEACRPTFITTSRTRRDLQSALDERITSRLFSFRWIGIGGEDKRITLSQGGQKNGTLR